MPASTATPDSSAPQVLIVDDEVNLRHLLRVILERDGHTVLEAGDGAQALRALQQHPSLRVVLCDVRMPRLDGLSFLDEVRGRGLPVVMMSAYGGADVAVDALNRGAFDYVSKPFRADEVRACVRRMLDQAGAAPPAPAPAPARRASAPAAPRAADAPVVHFSPDGGDSELSIKKHSAALEAHLIALALARTDGNRSQAARLLEISYKALAYKIRDYGLEGS